MPHLRSTSLRSLITGTIHRMTEAVLADKYDVLMFDLDGVLFVGAKPVPFAADVVDQVRSKGLITQFITNNASRTPEGVTEQLASVGVTSQPGDIVTSAQAAAAELAGQLPGGSKVLVVGGEGLRQALVDVGLTPVDKAGQQPAAVVQGFHPDVGWRDLAEGAFAVATGIPWVASNIDLTLPTEHGKAPGNGALVKAIEIATGRSPLSVGKPASPIILTSIKRSGAKLPLIIGDRLDTDIAAAHATQLPSMLVLTGVSAAADLPMAAVAQRPDYIGLDLRLLLGPEPAPVVHDGEETRVAGWTIEVVKDRIELKTSGESRADGIRCVAELCWNLIDDQQELPLNALELISSI